MRKKINLPIVSYYFSPIFSCLFLTPVQAQTTLAENEVIVHGIRDDYAGTSSNEFSVLKSKLKEIPQSVSVVDHNRIEQQNLNTLDQVLMQSTGVTSSPFHHYRTLYYVRGIQVNSFEIDGTPVLLSSAATSPQDMAVYEKVELLRGANGLLHGDGNPGATINMVRKKAPHESLADAQLQVSTWNRYRLQLDAGGELNTQGTLRGRAVVAAENRDFFVDRFNQKTQVFFVTLDADITSNTLFNIGAEYQSFRWKNPNIGGVPLSNDYQDLNLPRSTNLDTNWTRMSFYTSRIFSSLTQNFSDNWKGKVNLEYQKASANNRYGVYWGNVDKQTGDGDILKFLQANKFKNNSLSLNADVSGKIKLFGLSHDLLVGVSYSRESIGRLSANYDYKKIPDTLNVYHFNPYRISEPRLLAYKPKDDTSQKQEGIYGLVRIKLSPLVTVVAGGRESWWQEKGLKNSMPVKSTFTPYAGLIWDVTDNLSWYASFTNVYQPQSYYTYRGDLIDPLHGDSYETGIKSDLKNGFTMSLAAFRSDLTNNPIKDPANPGYYVNGSKAHSQGIEAEVNGMLTPWWNLYIGYTLLDTEQQTTITSKEVFNNTSPRHIVKAWTNYSLPFMQRKWSIGAGIQAQSEFTSSQDSHVRQGGYMLANLRLAYQFNHTWSAAVNVDNLFDRKYYSGIFDNHYNNRYGTPRDITLTVSGQFL